MGFEHSFKKSSCAASLTPWIGEEARRRCVGRDESVIVWDLYGVSFRCCWWEKKIRARHPCVPSFLPIISRERREGSRLQVLTSGRNILNSQQIQSRHRSIAYAFRWEFDAESPWLRRPDWLYGELSLVRTRRYLYERCRFDLYLWCHQRGSGREHFFFSHQVS